MDDVPPPLLDSLPISPLVICTSTPAPSSIQVDASEFSRSDYDWKTDPKGCLSEERSYGRSSSYGKRQIKISPKEKKDKRKKKKNV